MGKEDTERLAEENRRLKKDNEMLMEIIAQMKLSLNRLISHYITEQAEC